MVSFDSDELTATNTDLLIGLRDRSNDAIWTLFCRRYRTVLISFACRLGLSEQDAQDAAQDTLLAFAESYRKGKYDPRKGRLRTWLLGIASHKIHDVMRRNCRQPGMLESKDGEKRLEHIPDSHSMNQLWEEEWRRAILAACLKDVYRQIELKTLRAFELFVFEEWPVDKVASHLNMTRNAVYKAQRRVLNRLRERYKYLNTFW